MEYLQELRLGHFDLHEEFKRVRVLLQLLLTRHKRLRIMHGSRMFRSSEGKGEFESGLAKSERSRLQIPQNIDGIGVAG